MMRRALDRVVLGLLVAAVLGLWLADGQWLPPVGETALPDGGQHRGAMREGLFHGPGLVVWPNGRRYEGDFQQGLIHGQGELVYGDGYVYRGGFEDGFEEGVGEIHDGGELLYRGGFHRGRPHGFGEYDLGSQGIYRGDMEAGRLQGSGVLAGDESAYSGQFRDGQFHGEGVLELADGSRYSGGFRDGEFQGRGEFVDSQGTRYRGTFESGALSGEGTEQHERGWYRGQFEDWMWNGEGNFISAGGDIYKGQFDQGTFTGRGTHMRADGGWYEGEFRHWRYHGQGTLTEADGSVYRGEFRGGEPVAAQDGSALEIVAARVERALYRQPELLDAQLAAVEPSLPGVIEVFFVGVAGDGSERVFEREMSFVSEAVEDHFGGRGRRLLLVNSRANEDYPLATTTSVARAVEGMSGKMGEEDILFVYLTTHGSKDYQLLLDQPGLDLPDLAAADLASALDASSARYRAIVISACYSGGFIPFLADERTLVMTAAAADKTSFGCSDDSEATWFGRALFQEALPESASLTQAFTAARELIVEWEQERGITDSDPQIHAPQPVVAQLERLRTQRVASAASKRELSAPATCQESDCPAPSNITE